MKHTKKHVHKKKHTQSHAAKHAEHEHMSSPAAKVTVVKRDDSSLKNVAIIVLLVAVIALIIWAFTNTSSSEDSLPTSQVSSNNPSVRSAGDFGISSEIRAEMKELAHTNPYLGADDAPVVMVEFSDFQCGFCGRFHTQTFPMIKEKFIDTGYVKFVYRDLPFQPNAQKAAEASRCAHEQGMYWEYHDKLLTNQQALAITNLKSYAVELGLDASQFNTCLDTGKYADDVRVDAQAGQMRGISGTPGFVINGRTVSGAQPYDRFEQVICSMIPDSEPCSSIEPPVQLEVIILNDKSCATCDTTQFRAVLLDLFPGASFREVDAQTAAGKQFISEYNLVFAPSYIFPESLTQTNSWKTNPQLQGAFLKISDGYKIIDEATGSSYYLSEEVRQQQLSRVRDSLDLTSGDNMPQVDFFVMSYCPFGDQAEELLKPVFDELKGKAKFNPRYVIYGQGTGCYTDTDGTQLCSLKGGVELNQNVRELCVFNNYGEQEWFDFALAMNTQCNVQNADTCWTNVATSLGLDADMIQSCFDQNKVAYAREQYDLTQLMGVSGSPTVFFEGEQFNGARSSNAYLAALCEGFDQKPSECDNVVVETVSAPAQAQC